MSAKETQCVISAARVSKLDKEVTRIYLVNTRVCIAKDRASIRDGGITYFIDFIFDVLPQRLRIRITDTFEKIDGRLRKGIEVLQVMQEWASGAMSPKIGKRITGTLRTNDQQVTGFLQVVGTLLVLLVDNRTQGSRSGYAEGTSSCSCTSLSQYSVFLHNDNRYCICRSLAIEVSRNNAIAQGFWLAY